MEHPSKEEVMAKIQENDPDKVEVVKMIHIVTRKGDGSMGNLVRYIHHYYDMDGKKVFEYGD
ncbi:hypothetical protein [Furfurilactobacillus cerevisiae]|uniref:hypothetical protein n=1 Tax=Furfurilactobacillus rossiae TaxID=231049 RepID=UPI003B9822D9